MIVPVLEVAREHYNLEDCDDIYKNLNSLRNTLKQCKVFRGKLSAQSGDYNPYVYLYHNLGYYPLSEGFFKLGTETFYRQIPYMYRWNDGSYHKIEVGLANDSVDRIRLQLRTDDWRAVGETISLEYYVKVNLESNKDAWY